MAQVTMTRQGDMTCLDCGGIDLLTGVNYYEAPLTPDACSFDDTVLGLCSPKGQEHTYMVELFYPTFRVVEIAPIPVPAAGILLMSALLGLAVVSRLRKS